MQKWVTLILTDLQHTHPVPPDHAERGQDSAAVVVVRLVASVAAAGAVDSAGMSADMTTAVADQYNLAAAAAAAVEAAVAAGDEQGRYHAY